MTKQRTDPIAVIEAAYSLERDPQSWINRLVEAAHPSLDHGQGLFAYEYDLRDPQHLVAGAQAYKHVHAGLESAGRAYMNGSSEALNRIFHPRVPFFGTGSDLLGRAAAEVPETRPVVEQGMADGVAAVAAVGDGRGVLLGAVLASGQRLEPRLRSTWSRITMHIAAACRLRCALLNRATFDPVPDAAAILDPEGNVQHAVGGAKSRSARESLREAALRIDQARGALRHDDSERALALWRALVEGRWSLVDHFDSDGRRFVIATKNAPRATQPLCLTRRERQVAVLAAAGHANKLIAYDLGVSEGTVAATLSRAMQKLGVRSRTKLAMLMRDSL